MLEPSREFSGKTIDEAIQKGLSELGLVRDAVEVKVVREGSRGVLGLGSEDAIVRLIPMPASDSAIDANVSQVAQESLFTLLQKMGIKAQVEIQPDPGSESPNAFVLNIVGDDLGVLIGRRGETLRDLEYITRLMVTQKSGKSAKIVVDVEGYRTRRERVLRELAKRMAERVEVSRQPITLEAMPPNERRIIHMTLRDHPSVMTNSIGEGDHRRVMILHK
ncbi:MAG: protein jag [Chloroflexi bacterium]|nr:protein jag [Chloroflexota bacterium]